MSKPKQKLDLKMLLAKLSLLQEKLQGYSFVLFVVFIAGLYGFVLLSINRLSSQEPSSTAVSSQVQAAQVPHIDQAVVDQLNSLQDNSVNVKALFDQARSNPFQ